MKYLLLMLLSTSLYAANVELDWDQPTEREDGTALTKAEIKEYRIYHGKDADTQTFLRAVNSDHNHVILVDVSAGQNCYSASTVDKDDLEGRKSEVICIDVLDGSKRPERLTITVTIDLD